MKVDYPGDGKMYLTAEGPQDFSGWDVLSIERHKPGVCRVEIVSPVFRTNREIRIVYASDEHLPEHWIRPPEMGEKDVPPKPEPPPDRMTTTEP